jgi:hypothetical protein
VAAADALEAGRKEVVRNGLQVAEGDRDGLEGCSGNFVVVLV